MSRDRQFYCAGGWRSSANTLEVRNPFDDSLVGTTSFATNQDLEDAITAAEDAFEVMRYMPTFERVAALTKLATLMEQQQEELALLLSRESGKPLRDARVETARGVFTIQIAAEEARRMEGEMIPLDLMASSKGRFGVTRKVPIGPIAGTHRSTSH